MAGRLSENWAASEQAPRLAQGFAGGFEQVISALDFASSAPAFKLEPAGVQPEVWSAWVGPVWFELSCDVRDGAALYAGCALGTGRALAHLLSADESQTDQDALGTYKEILNESASVLGGVLAGHLGKPINFLPAAECGAPTDLELGQGFQFDLSEAKHVLALLPNPVLAQALLGIDGAGEGRVPARAGSQPPETDKAIDNQFARDSKRDLGSMDRAGRGNFDLLLEIEMQLGVSFGRTHLPLEEVLKLSSGAIVELNRSISDPVDVLVNDAVIARGEVVVVEGNYGVRITEIVSRRERIRSIM